MSEDLDYKLVLCDYDDTITLSDGTITPRTVEAIKAYREAGGTFVLCTGRSYASAKKQLQKIYGEPNPDVPVVCFQGGLVAYRDRVLMRSGMNREDVLRLVAEMEARGLICQLYSGDRMFVSEMTAQSRHYEVITDCKFELVGDIMSFIRNFDGDFDKLLVITEPAEVQALYDEFTGSGKYPDCKFVFSRPTYLEAIPRSSGKDAALLFLAKYMNVPIGEVAAFGDSNNDTDMLLAAGLGVAMGNARDETKRVADLIADTNVNDGLAKILETFVRARV